VGGDPVEGRGAAASSEGEAGYWCCVSHGLWDNEAGEGCGVNGAVGW
jgi:hypothetical protein